MPGGIGTLDELMEVLVYNQRANTSIPVKPMKPLGIYDIDSFFKPLQLQFDNMIKERYRLKEHLSCVLYSDDPEKLIHHVLTYKSILDVTPFWLTQKKNIESREEGVSQILLRSML